VRYPSGSSPGNVLGRLPRRQDEPLACKTTRRCPPSGRHTRDLDLPDHREHDWDRRLRFGCDKARILHFMVDHHGYVDPNPKTPRLERHSSKLTFLTRMDTVPVRIHRVHHHFNTLCRRSLPKQPRPCACARGGCEEHRLIRSVFDPL
jgi:hypothetical protein